MKEEGGGRMRRCGRGGEARGSSLVEGGDEGCFWKYSVIACESLPIMGGIESSCGNTATFQPRMGLSTLAVSRRIGPAMSHAHMLTGKHTDTHRHTTFHLSEAVCSFSVSLSSCKKGRTLAEPRLAPRPGVFVTELNEDCGKRKVRTFAQIMSSLPRKIPNFLVSSVSHFLQCSHTKGD